MGFWSPHVREAIDVFGAGRVLLGSDYGPVPISPAEHIDLVRSLHLDATDEDRVLGGNAEQIFRLPSMAGAERRRSWYHLENAGRREVHPHCRPPSGTQGAWNVGTE
jgi:hypothetical protein